MFILCAEGLTRLIQQHERMGLIHGARIARAAPSISSLLFADDSILFFKATMTEAETICQILKTYEHASGLEVNFYKSIIIFSTNTPLSKLSQVCDILHIHEAAQQIQYLGLPIWIGRQKVKSFNFIRDRVWGRLSSWKSKLLSRASKEVLLKLVIQSIPNHCMGVYLLPLDLCNALERMMNSFWWGNQRNKERNLMWMKWDRL